MQTAAERDAKIIAEATNWTAFAFGGRQARRREDCPSRDAAFSAAERLAKEVGRPALVYAVAANGQQALVGTVQP